MSDDLFNRGLSLAQGGHFQQAEQCLQTAVLFSPRDVEATLLLSHVQALQDDTAAAAATLERAHERGIRDPHLEKTATALQQILAETRAGAARPATINAQQVTIAASGISSAKPPSAHPSSVKHKHKKKHR
jgi:Flp pilus assembly protein TadD